MFGTESVTFTNLLSSTGADVLDVLGASVVPEDPVSFFGVVVVPALSQPQTTQHDITTSNAQNLFIVFPLNKIEINRYR